MAEKQGEMKRVRRMKASAMLYESSTDLRLPAQANHGRSFWEDLSRWFQTHPLLPLLPLAYKLLSRMLLTGWLWMWMTARLVFFAIVLFPAFTRGMWFYLTSSNIRRNVRFGVSPRNLMDMYFPPTSNERTGQRPVVVFVTGGAWIIGYKAWGALVARALSRAGVIACLPDYRNYPMGTASDMIADVDLAILWVQRNIGAFGGDPERVFVIGQSAGAHLCAMTVIHRARRVADADLSLSECVEGLDASDASVQSSSQPFLSSSGAITALDMSQTPPPVRAFIGLSGPYDLRMIVNVFHERGLDKSVLQTIFDAGLNALSPTACVGTGEDWVRHLPPIYLIHGGADKTCPVESSLDFAAALIEAGGGMSPPVNVRIYEGKSHTDPIIEDLMHEREDHKDFIGDVMQIIENELGFPSEVVDYRERKRTIGARVLGCEDEEMPALDYMLPMWVINVGRFINPF